MIKTQKDRKNDFLKFVKGLDLFAAPISLGF